MEEVIRKTSEEVKEWEISKQILKAHLLEQVIDGCGEAKLHYINSIAYYDDRSIDKLFGFIDRLDISKIYINEWKEVSIILKNKLVIDIIIN